VEFSLFSSPVPSKTFLSPLHVLFRPFAPSVFFVPPLSPTKNRSFPTPPPCTQAFPFCSFVPCVEPFAPPQFTLLPPRLLGLVGHFPLLRPSHSSCAIPQPIFRFPSWFFRNRPSPDPFPPRQFQCFHFLGTPFPLELSRLQEHVFCFFSPFSVDLLTFESPPTPPPKPSGFFFIPVLSGRFLPPLPTPLRCFLRRVRPHTPYKHPASILLSLAIPSLFLFLFALLLPFYFEIPETHFCSRRGSPSLGKDLFFLFQFFVFRYFPSPRPPFVPSPNAVNVLFLLNFSPWPTFFPLRFRSHIAFLFFSSRTP